MHDVLAWAAAPDAAKPTVLAYLRRSPAPAYVADVAQFLSTNDKTRTSITSTIMPALSWLTVESAAAAADPGGGLRRRPSCSPHRGTVFLLGGDDGQTAPLVAALTGHVAREARRLAGSGRSGRLDPPLTLALDEAALICPVPLDQWTADMGGRGVTIHIAVQSRAQLEQRWGREGAAAILNNAAHRARLRRHPRPARPGCLDEARRRARRRGPRPGAGAVAGADRPAAGAAGPDHPPGHAGGGRDRPDGVAPSGRPAGRSATQRLWTLRPRRRSGVEADTIDACHGVAAEPRPPPPADAVAALARQVDRLEAKLAATT